MHEPSSTVRTRATIDPTSSNVYREILKRVFIDALRQEQKRCNDTPIYDWCVLHTIMMDNWDLPISASTFYSVLDDLEGEGVLEYDSDEMVIIPKKLYGLTQ